MPLQTKNDKQLVKNYRLISLYPTVGKSTEKRIFNNIYHFLFCKRLINQSGFGISAFFTRNQLHATTHEIFEAFDFNLQSVTKYLGLTKNFM